MKHSSNARSMIIHQFYTEIISEHYDLRDKI